MKQTYSFHLFLFIYLISLVLCTLKTTHRIFNIKMGHVKNWKNKIRLENRTRQSSLRSLDQLRISPHRILPNQTNISTYIYIPLNQSRSLPNPSTRGDLHIFLNTSHYPHHSTHSSHRWNLQFHIQHEESKHFFTKNETDIFFCISVKEKSNSFWSRALRSRDETVINLISTLLA